MILFGTYQISCDSKKFQIQGINKRMKTLFTLISIIFLITSTFAEDIFIESPTDTDNDGKLDRIFVSVTRPNTTKKLSSIYKISPYTLGGSYKIPNHPVDSDYLPQDEALKRRSNQYRKAMDDRSLFKQNPDKYAYINAHSLGTGKSTGCPTVGDMSETLAAKAVIDWLNGKARGFSLEGHEIKADWSNGKVAMTGSSYNGTLPIMVAATGVEGLMAIVPIAAISNWYDYYRSNGLVVNPGGYIGEDADVLGAYVMRPGTCLKEMQFISQNMGRENGDFTKFWQDRNYLPLVKNFKAATFIIHGQSDWNVKQKHAIQLWESLDGVVPRRMFLHRGGHGSTNEHNVPSKILSWFDHFLENEKNGITDGPQVEVELFDGTLMSQEEWPNEKTQTKRFYFSSDSSLSSTLDTSSTKSIVDNGSEIKFESLVETFDQSKSSSLIFQSSVFETNRILSGTARINLNIAVLNRKAANITVALVAYDKSGKSQIITRGWVDPQNYLDITLGELLLPKKTYPVSFELEPKQTIISEGSKLGVVIGSTDYEYTLRPKTGTVLEFNFDESSFIDVNLSDE